MWQFDTQTHPLDLAAQRWSDCINKVSKLFKHCEYQPGEKRQARDHPEMELTIPVVQLTFPSFRSPEVPLQRALSLSMQGRVVPLQGRPQGII